MAKKATKKIAAPKMNPEFKDFRVFLTVLWKEMGMVPTKVQLLFADALQKSSHRTLAMLGYRGFAKTYILCAFCMWKLYWDPNLQISFWGSSQESAADSTKLMLSWLREIPWLQHMFPDSEQDQSGLSFDIRGRGVFRGSSVTARGITGTVTGTRADILVIDDPETSANGDTLKKRASIDRAMDEARYVIKDGGRIYVLGTVHFDDSLYTRLMAKGYKTYLFPMAVPSAETQKLCWPYYLPPLRKAMESLPEGTPLDRFSVSEIELKRQNGLLSFERQCLVNPFRTQLSNKTLDMRKIIIFPADTEKLPIRFFHGANDEYLAKDAMDTSSASIVDKLYAPYKWDDQMKPYDYKIAYIDPAGGGKDETALSIVGVSSGYAVLFHCQGFVGGASEDNLSSILEACLRYKVNEICIESNFGQEMFAQLLRAHYQRGWVRFANERDGLIPISTNRVSTNKTKMERIVSALDPVINFGRLIITPDALSVDFNSALVHESENRMGYRLSYQLSYCSDQANVMEHDDRIDSLAAAIMKVSGFLASHPMTEADSWDDYIVKKAFAADQAQFFGREEEVRVWRGEDAEQKKILPFRKSFIGGRTKRSN